MNTTVESADPSRSLRKRPWAALGVLAVAALAVAAAMVHVQTRPMEPHLVVLPDPEPTGTQEVKPAVQTSESATDTVNIGNPAAPR